LRFEIPKNPTNPEKSKGETADLGFGDFLGFWDFLGFFGI
jgi:hypothetical protein